MNGKIRQSVAEGFAWLLGVQLPIQKTDSHRVGDCASLLLAEIKNPSQFFYLKNGVPLKSLCDLENALEEMDNATFSHHVNESKNDFAVWVANVVHDRLLADKLQQFKSRQLHAKALKIRVDYLKQKAAPIQLPHAFPHP